MHTGGILMIPPLRAVMQNIVNLAIIHLRQYSKRPRYIHIHYSRSVFIRPDVQACAQGPGTVDGHGASRDDRAQSAQVLMHVSAVPDAALWTFGLVIRQPTTEHQQTA